MANIDISLLYIINTVLNYIIKYILKEQKKFILYKQILY
jgi:hypothetical protein